MKKKNYIKSNQRTKLHKQINEKLIEDNKMIFYGYFKTIYEIDKNLTKLDKRQNFINHCYKKIKITNKWALKKFLSSKEIFYKKKNLKTSRDPF